MFLNHRDDPPRPPEPPAHGHGYGPAKPRGTVGWCQREGCGVFAVSTGRGWREPTGSEKVSVVARMMEDLCMVDAMTIVHHNRRYAVDRVAQARGYRPQR